jgi:hypothetical protein
MHFLVSFIVSAQTPSPTSRGSSAGSSHLTPSLDPAHKARDVGQVVLAGTMNMAHFFKLKPTVHDKKAIVFPAKAGIHFEWGIILFLAWIPVFAGKINFEHFIFRRVLRLKLSHRRLIQRMVFLLFLFGFSHASFSQHFIDVYGLFDKQSEALIQPYQKKILALEIELQKQGLYDEKENTKALDRLLNQRYALMQEIKKQHAFLYVDFDTVFYPHRNDYYTTIEIVRADQAARLRFIAPKRAKRPLKTTHDVIDEMIDYERIGGQLALQRRLPLSEQCPVYHCFWGFAAPELKAYLPIFQRAVVKDRQLILHTLNHDPNPARREAASFLLGHFADPHEIIALLLPHITDPHESVRNSAMRVIGGTMDKAKLYAIDIRPFIDLLDSPYVTDRNKSLYVLSKAARIPRARAQILQKAHDKLLALAALAQPNNHDLAEQILKKPQHLMAAS